MASAAQLSHAQFKPAMAAVLKKFLASLLPISRQRMWHLVLIAICSKAQSQSIVQFSSCPEDQLQQQ